MIWPTKREIVLRLLDAVDAPERAADPEPTDDGDERPPFRALDIVLAGCSGNQPGRHHRRRLAGMATLLGLSIDEAADVVNDTFARLPVNHRRLVDDAMDGSAKAVPVLYRTALRLTRRRLGPGATPAAAPASGTEIVTVVRGLPARQRDLAALCLYAGLSTEEAAKTLRIQPLAASTHLANALDTLCHHVVNEPS